MKDSDLLAVHAALSPNYHTLQKTEKGSMRGHTESYCQ